MTLTVCLTRHRRPWLGSPDDLLKIVLSHDRQLGSVTIPTPHRYFYWRYENLSEPDRCAASRSTTIDHALIRGLATAFPISVVGLPLSKHGRKPKLAPTYVEGYPSCLVFAARPSGSKLSGAGACQADRIRRLMSQTNPTNSCAIAVMTFGSGFPEDARARYRWHSRTCAFQAIASTSSGSPSTRVR